MTKRIAIIASALAMMLAISEPAQANLVVTNDSDERIRVGILWTEIFSDSFVHHMKLVTIEPGRNFDFIINDVVLGRTVNVFIYVPTHDANYFDEHPDFTYEDSHYICHVIDVPRYSEDFRRFGDQSIAGPASNGDFRPLISARTGETIEKALHIKPLSRRKKGVFLTYHGIDRDLTFDSPKAMETSIEAVRKVKGLADELGSLKAVERAITELKQLRN